MVWYRPAVTRTLINSALVVSAPIFKCFIKSLDGVGRHAAVIARMSKIEACLDAGGGRDADWKGQPCTTSLRGTRRPRLFGADARLRRAGRKRPRNKVRRRPFRRGERIPERPENRHTPRHLGPWLRALAARPIPGSAWWSALRQAEWESRIPAPEPCGRRGSAATPCSLRRRCARPSRAEKVECRRCR